MRKNPHEIPDASVDLEWTGVAVFKTKGKEIK